VIRIATRASALARWQAERVGARLGRDVELVLVSTTGDRDQTSELHTIGGQGVFTKEVQQAVVEGRADVAVHSAKDLPTETPAGLVLATVPERADPRDALVGPAFEELVTGAQIGDRFRAAPRATGLRPVPISPTDRCAATSRRGCASAPSWATTRSSSRSRRSIDSG